MINKTVALVNEWGNFEAMHPDGNIEDFCRHYLARKRQQNIEGPLTGGVVPQISGGLLMKLIGRIHKLHVSYVNNALEGTGLKQIEELGILLTILLEKNPRKTDVIYANLFELSSGTDMLNRLKKRKLIREYNDKDDKRSKRIELTPDGAKAMELGKIKIVKVAEMITNDLTEDDKQLCIQLLKNIEIKFSALWQQHKGKTFDDVYKSLMEEDREIMTKKKR